MNQGKKNHSNKTISDSMHETIAQNVTLIANIFGVTSLITAQNCPDFPRDKKCSPANFDEGLESLQKNSRNGFV